MKAAINSVYGPPSVIQVKDIPKPTVKDDEVLIEVRYSSVNRTDAGFLRAKPFPARFVTGLFAPKYLALGCEFAGTVAQLGSEVTEFKKGDRVFGFDDNNFGGFAEFKAIKASQMIGKIPDGIDYREAAAATEGAHYALFYINSIPASDSLRIFVNGGTGAIGSAAVQLLKERGAYVCASSTTEMLETVKQLGADRVLDWQKGEVDEHDEQYDAYLDAVGKSTFNRARKNIKPGGLYMSSELGPRLQNPLFALINPLQRLFTKRNIKFPIPKTRKEEVAIIQKSLASGDFKPLIDREYTLKDIRKAFEYVETGTKNGSVLVKIASS